MSLKEKEDIIFFPEEVYDSYLGRWYEIASAGILLDKHQVVFDFFKTDDGKYKVRYNYDSHSMIGKVWNMTLFEFDVKFLWFIPAYHYKQVWMDDDHETMILENATQTRILSKKRSISDPKKGEVINVLMSRHYDVDRFTEPQVAYSDLKND
jgi:lipocalin